MRCIRWPIGQIHANESILHRPAVYRRIFGGLFNDIRNRFRYYGSDIIDGFHPQCLASTIFLFFACIAPIVTFGGLMGQKTDNYMVSAFVFSGQCKLYEFNVYSGPREENEIMCLSVRHVAYPIVVPTRLIIGVAIYDCTHRVRMTIYFVRPV